MGDSRQKSRLRWSAAAVAALSALGLGAAGPAAAVPSTATCAPVEVITARGQGEPAGNGYVLGPIANSLQQRLTQGVKIYPLPYSAGNDIIASVNSGVTALTSRLDTLARTCPNTKTVVLGFSMGALVAGETFAPSTRYPGVVTTALPTRVDPRVAAVIVFGDTRFNAAGPEARGSFWPGISGLYPRSANAFSRFNGKVANVCNSQDPICQSIEPAWTLEIAHQDYVKYTDGVIDFVKARLP